MARKTLAVLVLALVLPAVASAAKPQHPSTSKSTAAPKVMYVLKGTLWNYTAASSTADGSVTIHVTHSNYHGRALRGLDLTFAVSTNTATAFQNGATTISNGARGIVKFHALKNMSTGGLLTALSPDHMTAFQVIDKGLPRQDMLIPPTR